MDNTKGYFTPLTSYLKKQVISVIEKNKGDAWLKCIFRYGVLLFVLFFILIIIYISTTDIKSISSNLYFYYGMILLPIIGGVLFSFPLFSKFSGSPIFFLLGAISVFVLIGIIYFYSKLKITQSIAEVSNIIIFLVGLLIFLVGLAIFYKLFLNYLNRQTGWLGFFIQFLFYLPCLIIDFIQYQYANTSTVVFILFVMEIMLVLSYIYIPILIEKLSISSNNIDLLTKSTFLNESMTITKNQIFQIPSLTKGETTFRKNYAFSMWIYINTPESSFFTSSNKLSIFNFGNGKPSISYSGGNQEGKFQIQYSNNDSVDESVYHIDIPSQKWNYIVFNINDNVIDLFVNGVLIKSMITNHNNIASFSVLDNVTIGQDNGIDGAICNIKYYTSPMTKHEITNSYNLLMYKNPPVQ